MISVNIDKIRRDKNITINDTVNKVFSRMTYNNFKKGKHDIKLTNFLLLIDNIYLLSEEIDLLINNSSNKVLKNILNELRSHTIDNDVKSMYKLKNKVAETEYFFSQHLVELIEFRMERSVGGSEIDVMNSSLVQHLIKAEKWTRYEILLFTNAMFIFNSELIDLSLNRVFKSISKSDTNKSYGNEEFRILLDAYIVFFERRDYVLMNKWKQKLEDYELSPVFFFERTLQSLFIIFLNYIKEEDRLILKKAYNISTSLSKINCDEYAEIIFDMCEFIENKYGRKK